MKNSQKIYIGCESAGKKGWNALYLTPAGLLKKNVPRYHQGCFPLPFSLRNISMHKLYCKAWKSHLPDKMLALTPGFVQEVFAFVLKRKKKPNGIEAMLWAINIGKQMMDMPFKILTRKERNSLLKNSE